MKKFIAVLLLVVGPLVVFAQDTVVVIKPSTAEYFLEADDERYLLRDKVIVLENDVRNLEQEVYNLNGVIMTHVLERVKETEEYNLVIDELNTCYADQDNAIVEIERLEKRNKKERIVAAVLIVLALLL